MLVTNIPAQCVNTPGSTLVGGADLDRRQVRAARSSLPVEGERRRRRPRPRRRPARSDRGPPRRTASSRRASPRSRAAPCDAADAHRAPGRSPRSASRSLAAWVSSIDMSRSLQPHLDAGDHVVDHVDDLLLRVSGGNTTISSTRLRNSGRKCCLSSSADLRLHPLVGARDVAGLAGTRG